MTVPVAGLHWLCNFSSSLPCLTAPGAPSLSNHCAAGGWVHTLHISLAPALWLWEIFTSHLSFSSHRPTTGVMSISMARHNLQDSIFPSKYWLNEDSLNVNKHCMFIHFLFVWLVWFWLVFYLLASIEGANSQTQIKKVLRISMSSSSAWST